MKVTNKFVNPGVRYVASAMLLLMMSVPANALSLGTYLGTFSGNDSVNGLFHQLGLTTTYLDKIETPALSTEDFVMFNTVLKDGDDDSIISGDWEYTGEGIVTHIVIKAGPRYAVYEFTDGLNMGSFTTEDVRDKGVSHITAYSAAPVPIPGALWLMAGGLAGLLRLRKKT